MTNLDFFDGGRGDADAINLGDAPLVAENTAFLRVEAAPAEIMAAATDENITPSAAITIRAYLDAALASKSSARRRRGDYLFLSPRLQSPAST